MSFSKRRFLALDGVACCFKSTALKSFELEKYSVQYGDFSEVYKNTTWVENRNILQLWYAYLKFTKKYEVGVLYERHPVSVLLYAIIHDYPGIGDDELQEMLTALEPQMSDWRVLVVLPKSNPDDVLSYMQNRDNGLDTLTREYVEVQTRIFNAFAHHFRLPTVMVDHCDPENSIDAMKISIRLYLFGEVLTNTPSLKPFHTDVGIDLHLAEAVTCGKAGRPVELLMRERLILPPECGGYVLARSSTNRNLGTVRPGVMDPGYFGPIKCMFVPDHDGLTLEVGQRIAQVVVVGAEQRCIKHIGHPHEGVHKLITGLRGDAGFGSSGKL